MKDLISDLPCTELKLAVPIRESAVFGRIDAAAHLL